jgi:signal transduction histidine kinase
LGGEQVVERVVAGQRAVGDAARRSTGLDDLVARVTAAAAESVGAFDVAYWRVADGEAVLIGGHRSRLPASAEGDALRADVELRQREWVIHTAFCEGAERQVLAVIWRAGGVRLGVCCAYGPRDAEAFTPDDALVLQVVSNSCGNVVERQQMVERLRHTMHDLNAAEVRLGRVLDLGQSLNSIRDPETLLDQLVPGALELVGASAGFAGRARPEGAVTHQLLRSGETEPFEHTWPPGDGIPGWCVLSRSIYVANDVAHDARADHTLRELGVREVLCAPIVDAQDVVLGFFALFDKPGGFEDGDRRVAEALASHSAMALRNAIAYQRLGDLERFKSDFLNLAAHELRGPIAVARGYLEMLADDPDRWDRTQRQSMLRVTTRKLDQMRLLVDRMLETARLDDHPPVLELQSVDLRELVRTAAAEVQHAVRPEHELVLDLGDEPVWVQVDPDRIRRVVANLIENACKYSPDGGLVRVGLSAAGTPPWAEIEVEDHGVGIDDGDFTRLFTRFGRIVNKRNSHISGTGLGLYLARQLTRMHGGDISVESEPARGSRFIIRLPPAYPVRHHDGHAPRSCEPVARTVPEVTQ